MVKIPKQKLLSKKTAIRTKSKAKKSSAGKLDRKRPEVQQIPTRRLLTSPEGLQVDFKRDAEGIKPDDIVAFANGGGGTILIGVDEIKGINGVQRGKVVGCDVSDRERNKIVSRANNCRPAIPVQITVESYGKRTLMRVDISKGGLHCTSNGTYKIHRDGQNDIIDPSLMAKIIVKLERYKILAYLREAVQPEIVSSRDEMEMRYEEAMEEIENLKAELEDARNEIDYDPDY
jgi:predicted HTH transcriptional regulator